MTSITTTHIQQLANGKGAVVSDSGDKIGSIGQLFLDDVTGEPTWVTVKTGLFGTSESFIPLDRATAQGDDLRVPYDKAMVKDAPRVDADQHLTPQEEEDLYRYYGLDYATSGYGDTSGTTTGMAGTTGTTAGTAATTNTDRDRRDVDDASVIRSEERVDVGTRQREAGKVRLRKYVVTENVTKTVPVTREEVRLEREPVTAGDRVSGQIGDDVAEVTLHEDEVVVDKETVPVEKVSLGKDTVTEQREVTEQVRKERVETDTDRDVRR
ncbi:DUF2382 domain-containing protein [Georgenia yuyongxinii]|uniref:DUF2382 domain-containing protein n=1 Tax=Georgenia yuyongxinii TaxID=2589797 RepID=A0A5B8C9R4_9MICO|nr:YsnF/AvaK domain-containing protein [Georgenia yuyongxinii]QDC26195.1 DUF2382 domain-containing protein [Georgenia yuyongxinii]